VVKTADWIIDLGPEGGAGGGQVIAAGTPEQIAQAPASHTGHYLRPVLQAAARGAKPREPASPSRNGRRKVSSDLLG
jgi:excinuclease ABC subunit A